MDKFSGCNLSGHENLLRGEDLQAGRIELAREMFLSLESRGVESVAEVAKRAFCIQDRLATFRD